MADNPEDLAAEPEAGLILDLDGFEGPLDLLLALARSQKVDLLQISVLSLAEQYLAAIDQARALRIELAADWLVMAAWLAFLKSRLLLPPDPQAEGPSADEMASVLAERLARLNALREAAAKLMARDRLGQDRFVRGTPQAITTTRHIRWQVGLLDLMQAYARLRTRDEFRPFAFDRTDVFTMEAALERLRRMLGSTPVWAELDSFLPEGWGDPARLRSATAATFAAALELARQGAVELRQDAVFAPISLRAGSAGRPRLVVV